MPKIILHYILAPLFSIVAIFFLLLYLNNGYTLVITMPNESNKILTPQIYFPNKIGTYDETSAFYNHYKSKNNLYYFEFPKIKNLNAFRLDPARKQAHIALDNITLIHAHWFKETSYKIPLSFIKPMHQIRLENVHKQRITFYTTGKDGQLQVNFKPHKMQTVQKNQTIRIFISFLIYLFLRFIYTLYKQQEHTNYLYSKIILYSLFFALMIFKVTYYKEHIHPYYPPDEIAHLSYIEYIHTHPNEIIPTFEEMTMINNKQAGNYLSHPSFYYYMMNLVYDVDKPVNYNIDTFRTLSMLLYILTFMLILYLVFSSSWGMVSHFVFLSFLSSVPMHTYIGASINNDTLGMLGAIIFIVGFKNLLEKHYTTATYFTLGLGIFIAYFSKLTAAMLILFVLVFYFIQLLRTKEWFKITPTQLVLLFAIVSPVALYQIYIFMHYHALIPTFNVTHPQEYLRSVFYVPEALRKHFDLSQWFMRLVYNIKGGWFGIHSHHSFVKYSWLEYFGLLVLHLFALFALLLKCKPENKTYCTIGKFTLLSLLVVITIQFFFSYKTHLSSGYVGGLQPRYLLPFMFGFAIMASIFVERYKKIFIFNIFVILLCIQAIYSDFFYFLNNYI